MSRLISEKLDQACKLVAESGLDVWLTFVRETFEGGDPVLPFLVEGALTWQSAFLISRRGAKVAIVGNFDSGPIESSGDWDKVVPYVQGIRAPLIAELEDLVATAEAPRIGVNFSPDDVKADGLSHGMFVLLEKYLAGTRFEGSLVSADTICMKLRACKSSEEIWLMRKAIDESSLLFDWVVRNAKIGMTELELYRALQTQIDAKGLGYSWDRAQNPIVNFGPDSMLGHSVPSSKIQLAPGQILHIDLGVTYQDYSSDIQTCWYVPNPGESAVPEDVQHAMNAVVGSISAGAGALRPGVQGWEVDAISREFLVNQGYPEYMHAFGHQVGRVAHDGGAILGPKWERYGKTPMMSIPEGAVFTLEPDVFVEGRGYLGIEEMAQVVGSGLKWLTNRQMKVPILALQ